MIAAIAASNRAIGRKNGLLWHLPDDLKHFKALTTGHPIIMGARTYASIGRPLPNRTNIVLCADAGFEAPGCTVLNSLGVALDRAKKESDEVFVIGGGQVYTAALSHVDRLYLTLVDGPAEDADTFFPEYEKEFTKLVSEESGIDNGIPYRRIILER